MKKIAEDDTVNDVNGEHESEDDEIEGNKFNDPWGRRGETDFAFLIAMIDCDYLLPVYFFFWNLWWMWKFTVITGRHFVFSQKRGN